mmetsp:Transcript_15675/g.24514  ORF Transcript_15675/g.24514 Transcript_15675/m.24514 type:complete len:263 (+) Transcript_15675:62-850(+)
MLKAITFVVSCSGLVLHAQGVNICASDTMCGFLGGTCLSGTNSEYKCEKKFLFKQFCGGSEGCSCCTKLTCEETPSCGVYGGSCDSEASCNAKIGPHRWVAGLCSANPFVDSVNCGCCIPVYPPTPEPTSFPTSSPTVSPTSCPLSDACQAVSGDCISMQSCSLDKTWDPTLCSSQLGSFCGCCYSQTGAPTTSPTPFPGSESPTGSPSNPPSPTSTPPPSVSVSHVPTPSPSQSGAPSHSPVAYNSTVTPVPSPTIPPTTV